MVPFKKGRPVGPQVVLVFALGVLESGSAACKKKAVTQPTEIWISGGLGFRV